MTCYYLLYCEQICSVELSVYHWLLLIILSHCDCVIFDSMAISIIPNCVFLVRLRTLDAVVITHSHADAIGGLWNWQVKSWPSIIFLFHVFFTCKVMFCLLNWSLLLHWFVFCSPGLDDLRDWTNNVQPHIPIYTAMRDLEVYLFYPYSWIFPSSLAMLFQ